MSKFAGYFSDSNFNGNLSGGEGYLADKEELLELLKQYNENAEEKINDFNSNATNKTDEFNENYIEKLGLFNEDANVQRIADLEDEVESLNQDLNGVAVNSEELIEESLTVNDSADKVRFNKFSVQGASDQVVRSGKNFLNLPEEYSVTGVVNELPISLEPGEYTISCKSVVSDGSATRFLIYLRFEDATSLSVYTYFDTLKTTFSIAKKAVNFNLYSQDLYASSQGVTTVFEGLQIEEGTVATEYEEPGASPSTEYPSEIKNVTSVNGKIVGKNWFDKNNYNLINAYIVVDSPEIILPNDGGTQNQCVYIRCKPNTRYTISKKVGQRFGAAYSINTPAPGITVYGCRTNPTASTLTILTGETAKYLIVYIRNGNNQNELTLQEVLDSLQIEENSKATPYEAYQGQTFAFPLAENQKMYQDSYLAEDGIHHKRGTIIYNGSEEWTTASSLNNDESCWFTVAKPSNMLIALLAKGEIMSDHFKNYNCYAATNLEDGICTHASGGVMVRIKKSNLLDTTTQSFKNWLAEHNVTVEYPLAEEEIIPYTTEQKQAYESLKNLYTYKGTTHVFFDDEVSPKADLIYRKDIETLINNLQTAIVAIGGEE